MLFLNRLVVSEGFCISFSFFSLYICFVVRFVFALPHRFLALNNIASDNLVLTDSEFVMKSIISVFLLDLV